MPRQKDQEPPLSDPNNRTYQQMLEVERTQVHPHRQPVKSQIDAANERITQQLEQGRKKHPASDKKKETRKEKRKRMKNDKGEFPQRWDLEQVHHTMGKRPAPLIEIPDPKEVFPVQENKDRRRLFPRSKRWGKYNNLSREELANLLMEEGPKNIKKIREWVEKHPNHPKAEYYRKNLLNDE